MRRVVARLRAVFSNATEGNLLRRSLQRDLYKDKTARRLTGMSEGPLFGDATEAHDIETGTIYALRSLADHPYVAAHREVLHKIGVTAGPVSARIAHARLDPADLLADVEIIATYKLSNLNRSKLETVFHRLFGAAQLDLMFE